MLCVNIELADKMQESADDITAAETAPNPKNDTHYFEIDCKFGRWSNFQKNALKRLLELYLRC